MMSENNAMGPADIAAVMDGGRNGGNGWFGDGSFWIIILFLFAMFGNNGWNGGGGNGGYTPALQSGFDQAAVMGGLNAINSGMNAGFATAEIAACGRAADALSTAYNNQIATMNQNFAAQTALNAQLNGISSSLDRCCCENRAATADLRYTVATEACADRSAVNDALQAVLTTMNAQVQSLKDQMCQDKIDAKNERIQELQTQLNMMNLAASQNAQTAQILANNEAQTAALEAYLQPPVRPCYVVPNPNCCGNSYNGCNCGVMA